VLTDFGSHNDFANAVAIRDGKLVAVGSGNRVPGPNDFALARYTADGSLDPSFGRGGKVLTDLGSDSDTANAVATEADGKLVAAGQGVAFALARYTADGSLDPRFGRGGKVLTGFGSLSDIAHAVAIQADGKLVAAGLSRRSGYFDFALARYTPHGRLDRSFGRGGKVLTDVGSDWVTRVASLTARRTKSGVLVHWRTASEVDARAFNVYRHQNRGRLMRVNRKLITSKGSASHGAAYSFLDRHAPLSTQRYWLEEVRRNGTRLRLGQVTVIR
jgi:uncharacterized delta-60 repeat protein